MQMAKCGAREFALGKRGLNFWAHAAMRGPPETRGLRGDWLECYVKSARVRFGTTYATPQARNVCVCVSVFGAHIY